MKYRVLRALYSVGRGDLVAVVDENGLIELPDEIAEELIATGELAPEPVVEEENGLYDVSIRQARTRQQRKRR